MEQKDLNKLSSIDASGARLNIIPADVQGFFRRHRNWSQAVLLIIFLGLPWIEHNGQQIVLLDIINRRFHLFGLTFQSHDAPLLFFLLAIATLGLAFVTAVWGRVWCGWACPQTVFIDAVYRRIEEWTEGSYIERRKLRTQEFSLSKFRKTGSKWLLFTAVSSLFAHSFVAYFVGSKSLLAMMQKPPAENWTYFLLIAGFTLLLLFDFAWFREQFCVIMCPYGRIQSVLLEPSSMAIVYDTQRGEPRRQKTTITKKTGDCVSCNRCVEVCPTGIDIRNGLQMECISCTACIDACDAIMTKVKKPPGLIRYQTLDGSKINLFKFKTLSYAALITIATVGLIYTLLSREDVNISVLRAIDTPYELTTDINSQPTVLNHFRLHLNNQLGQSSRYHVTLSSQSLARGVSLTVAQNSVVIKPYGNWTWHLFVTAPRKLFEHSGTEQADVILTNDKGEIFTEKLALIGPKK